MGASKRCAKCSQFLPHSAFRAHKSGRQVGQLYSYCRPCATAIKREVRKKCPESEYVSRARYRAKVEGIPFQLTVADVTPMPECCPALGIPLIHFGGKVSDNSPSLDRLKPELGYVAGNVRWLSMKANRIKNNATLEELERVTQWTREQLRPTPAV